MNQTAKSRLLLVGFMGSFLLIFLLLFQFWGSYLSEKTDLRELPNLIYLNPNVQFTDQNSDSISFKTPLDKITVLAVSHYTNLEEFQYTYSVLLDLHGSLKRKKTGKIISLIISNDENLTHRVQEQLNSYWKPDNTLWTIAGIDSTHFQNLTSSSEYNNSANGMLLDSFLYLIDKNGVIRAKYEINQNQITARVMTDISLLLRKEKH